MKRTRIVDLLKREDYGSQVCVKGWVRTKRGSKAVNFIALNDGSTINNVQVVADVEKFDPEMMKLITTGACLSVEGQMVQSIGSGQAVEIQATDIQVLGECPADYPMQKKGQSFEYMRQHAHMRLRTNTFGAVMRIRHNMAMAIHTYFHEHGYFYFHTPLITASDCEGAGNMFQVTTKNLYDLKKDEQGKIIYDDDFFGQQTSLTVSGQLEGELGATALGAIYTFGPTFRAENSNTPRHLAEFWMIEPEVAFLDQEELMDLEEDFIFAAAPFPAARSPAANPPARGSRPARSAYPAPEACPRATGAGCPPSAANPSRSPSGDTRGGICSARLRGRSGGPPPAGGTPLPCAAASPPGSGS